MKKNNNTYIVKKEGCRGRLMIKCPHCERVHSYFQNAPTTEFKCRNCDTTTELKELHFCKIICKCGSVYKCLTNITDEITDGKCINCQAPVTIEWNKKIGCYCTVL